MQAITELTKLVQQNHAETQRRLTGIEDKLMVVSDRLIRVEEKTIASDQKLSGLTDRYGAQETRMWALTLAIIALLGSALVKVFVLPS